jgi:predicted transcriptional regulator
LFERKLYNSLSNTVISSLAKYDVRIMKYRSRTEIASNMLEAANGGGATKTKIMYRAFLSYAQLKEYLGYLTENNLLTYYTEDGTYRTTTKGIKFLATTRQLDGLLEHTTLAALA